jgi:hypothetical protein
MFFWAAIYREISDKLTLEIQNSIADTKIDSEIFTDINVPFTFEPETVLIEQSIQIIEMYISNTTFTDANSDALFMKALSFIASMLDYKVIYQSMYDNLCNLKYEKAKGLRAFQFLYAFWKTFTNYESELIEQPSNIDSYYNSLENENDFYCITINYTQFLLKIIGKEKVNYLHGNTSEWLVFETGEIIGMESKDLSPLLQQSAFCIPNLTPQSRFKPILSIEMLLRFSDAYDAMLHSKKIETKGFGFQEDDSHIARLVYSAMQANPLLELVVIAGDEVLSKTDYIMLANRYKERVFFELY